MFRYFTKLLFDLRIFIGSILFAIILFVGLLLFLLTTRSIKPSDRLPTVVLNVIPAPTLTPAPLATSTISSTLNVTLTPSSIAKEISIGAYVQVNGTGGDGLRLRSSPGLDSKVDYLAGEGEIFRVEDGPSDNSGYTWWYLIAPIDQTVGGWAVANFLLVIESP